MKAITDAELDKLPEKTKKVPEVVQMYKDHPFLEAYGMHTDWRVVHNGPEGAIGAVHDWERHGKIQFDFLLSQGLKPEHKMTEIGCGTGRLARKVVPYLDRGNYIGCDISEGALESAAKLSYSEGWSTKWPKFFRSSTPPTDRADYLWAFSVFIHLPEDIITQVMQAAAVAMHKDSKFFFSYVPSHKDIRTGLKQFKHTLQTTKNCCREAGLRFEQATSWNAEQKIALATLK